MNRVLKFRVWSEKDSEFIDPTRFGIGYDGELTNMWDGIFPDPMLGFTIQQFTGLQDGGGKEIYEGDILNCDEWVFNNKTESFEAYRKNAIGHIWYANPCSYIAEWAISFNHLYSESSCKFGDLRNVKIIGNIFENSDLLA
jgi:uncharacterized phage protein (TIGR01671 family)